MRTFIGVALLALVLSLSVFGIVIVKKVQLKQNCTGYLKRAADANTVEVASQELQKAIDYLESNNLTSGYTSIVWRTPDEDIEFWYNNLKASQDELSKVDSTTTSLEKTNLLMKLRETLLDSGEKGSELTVPCGLSRYPHNSLFSFLMWLSSLLIITVVIWFIILLDEF
jgi:hypothetical protein